MGYNYEGASLQERIREEEHNIPAVGATGDGHLNGINAILKSERGELTYHGQRVPAEIARQAQIVLRDYWCIRDHINRLAYPAIDDVMGALERKGYGSMNTTDAFVHGMVEGMISRADYDRYLQKREVLA